MWGLPVILVVAAMCHSKLRLQQRAGVWRSTPQASDMEGFGCCRQEEIRHRRALTSR